MFSNSTKKSVKNVKRSRVSCVRHGDDGEIVNLREKVIPHTDIMKERSFMNEKQESKTRKLLANFSNKWPSRQHPRDRQERPDITNVSDRFDASDDGSYTDETQDDSEPALFWWPRNSRGSTS